MKDIQQPVDIEILKVQNEIPSPKDRLLLLDKDLTLVDHSYNMTDHRIHGSIQDIQSQGWTVGLSSDTPLESLKQNHQELGLNGPIIAERGAITHENDQVYLDEADLETFMSARAEMIALMQEAGIPVGIHSGLDISQKTRELGQPLSRKAFINGSRRLSIGMYFRSYDDAGNPFIDNDFTAGVADALKPLYPAFEDLFVDLNHDYGILILSRIGVDKRLATLNHMQRNGYTQIGMVGNAITDYVGSDIALHYAVGNSTEEFKNAADYVAKGEITSGVVEILEKLVESN